MPSRERRLSVRVAQACCGARKVDCHGPYGCGWGGERVGIQDRGMLVLRARRSPSHALFWLTNRRSCR
jgi:hypothetical protein